MMPLGNVGIAEAEAADVEELFCLAWERWSEELNQAVASNQPWPMPPVMDAPAALYAAARVAEAAMSAVAAIWSIDVEYRKLLQHAEQLQGQLRVGMGKDPSPGSASLPLHEQQRLAKALLNEEQEVRRLREREKALSEQLASARATARKLKDRDASYSATDLERQAALTSAKRQEASAKQQFHDRESEIQSLRREVNELSSQLTRKDAVQASLSKQIRQLNIQLQKARQQRQELTSDLKHYLSSMQDTFAADELRESAVDEVLRDRSQPAPAEIRRQPSARSPRGQGLVRFPAQSLKQEGSLSAKLLEFDRPESPRRFKPLDEGLPSPNSSSPWRSRSPDRSPGPSPSYFEVTEADILGDWADPERSPSPSSRRLGTAQRTKSKSPVRFTSSSPRSRGLESARAMYIRMLWFYLLAVPDTTLQSSPWQECPTASLQTYSA